MSLDLGNSVILSLCIEKEEPKHISDGKEKKKTDTQIHFKL